MSVNLERDLEIQWKLLCIYYDKLYSLSKEGPDPTYKLAQDENIDYRIINTNVICLIDEHFLEGTINYTTAIPIATVTRINSRGIKLVEKLYQKSYDSLNDETKSKLDSIQSKTERVCSWIKSCIQVRQIIPEILSLMKDHSIKFVK